MQRRFIHATLTVIALAALACDSPMQPERAASAGPSFARSESGQLHANNVAASAANADAPGQVVACSNRQEAYGSALIGPSGGTLVVGNSRLIIPPGALSAPTLISGTVPDTSVAVIEFEPTGLQFKKPAGLQLDVSGCAADSTPAVVYVDDAGNTSERIDAVFSNDWHTVAAPIAHFSGYAFAF